MECAKTTKRVSQVPLEVPKGPLKGIIDLFKYAAAQDILIQILLPPISKSRLGFEGSLENVSKEHTKDALVF